MLLTLTTTCRPATDLGYLARRTSIGSSSTLATLSDQAQKGKPSKGRQKKRRKR
jgi:hypothetical protein